MRTQSSALTSARLPFYTLWLLKRLPFDLIEFGSLTLKVGEYQRQYVGASSGVQAELTINQPLPFIWLLSTQGELGFAKAYANGVISTPCLYALLHFGMLNEQALKNTIKGNSWFYKRFLNRHRNNHNSIKNSKENISAHYDLGNDFYELWLDGTMSYSSALFTSDKQSLEQAQHNKYQRICHELALKATDHILEIGCGWGGFAETAAQQGAEITAITLSTEQLAFAKQRLKDQGLDQKTHLQLTDYRQQQGQFDHIVSIEMFEAVGKEYWDNYFSQLKRLLKKDGKAVLQVITISDERAANYQQNVDFIQAFIFPGGLLPSKTQLYQLAEKHGFTVSNALAFGKDYAATLLHWRKQFEQHSHRLKSLGYDTRFQRIWYYYLEYCRVGFDTLCTDVLQLTLTHKKTWCKND